MSSPNYADAMSSWFAKALAELGLKPLAGLTSGKLFGYSYVLLTLDPATQTRSCSETSYLREAIEQTTNLISKNQLWPRGSYSRIMLQQVSRLIAVEVATLLAPGKR